MENLAAAGNVEVPAYLALQELGFAIERHTQDSDTELWVASNSTFTFFAPSLLELLGLFTMRQIRGPNWKADDDQIDRYLSTYYPQSALKT